MLDTCAWQVHNGNKVGAAREVRVRWVLKQCRHIVDADVPQHVMQNSSKEATSTSDGSNTDDSDDGGDTPLVFQKRQSKRKRVQTVITNVGRSNVTKQAKNKSRKQRFTKHTAKCYSSDDEDDVPLRALGQVKRNTTKASGKKGPSSKTKGNNAGPHNPKKTVRPTSTRK